MIRVVDGRYQSRRLADRWLSMNRLPYQLQLDNLRDLEPNHRQCHCNTRCHIQRRCCVRYKSKNNALHIEQQEIIELLKEIEVHFEGDQVSDAGTETLPHGEDLDVCDVRNGSALCRVDEEVHPQSGAASDQPKDNSKGVHRAEPESMVGVLAQFLRKLRTLGLDPAFFGTDIRTCRRFLPCAKCDNPTLLYWHM